MTLSEIPSGITPGKFWEPPPARCAGCGKVYVRSSVRQTRCRPDCGRSRAWDHQRSSTAAHKARKEQRALPRRFIGVDGEGVTDPVTGEHKYVLLSVGDKHLSLDGAHLQFGEVVTFLWSCFEDDPEAIYVGFYLGYDFTQWFRTLSKERAMMLLDEQTIAAKRKRKNSDNPHAPPWPVRHLGWEFDYLPKKRFKLRPEGAPPANAPKKLVITYTDEETGEQHRSWKWMYVNDAGSYFQCTFLTAIDPKGNPNPVVTPEEFAIIERGKARRSSAEFDPAMVTYNLLECQVLARLMQQLEIGVRAEGLKPSRKEWHGPGQIAQLWMRKIDLPKADEVRKVVPEAVRDAARGSYFGGWFEIFWHGLAEGTSYAYDINSCYPFVMSRLPCLMHGHWTHKVEKRGGRRLSWAEKEDMPGLGLAFLRAWIRGGHPLIGAASHRNANRTICRPLETEGWFVAAELAAGIAAGFVDDVRVYETWTYHPCGCPPPLAPIADLYNGRLIAGKNSPAGKARKLIYNSVAGKNQQSVGNPAYGNAVWATLITSGCRQMITEAIASHPSRGADLLMVATDGLVFRSPHPLLPIDASRLGAWTASEHQNLCLFMPGVYWDDRDRRRIEQGLGHAFKSRGVAAKDLAKHIAEIDAAWLRGGWPLMELDVSFQLVSLKQALQWGKWELAGTVNTDKKRVISADPSAKRIATVPGQSLPYAKAAELKSLPYDGLFGDEMRAFSDSEFGDHPDGRPADLLVEALGVG